MQRNTMIVAVVLIVVVGGSLVVFLPQLLPRTEWRFQEGGTGVIGINVSQLENCSITIGFVNDTGLMMKYAYISGAGGIAVTQEPTSTTTTTFQFRGASSGVVESGALTITLGSNAVYDFNIYGADVKVSIEYNEYTTLTDGLMFRMDCTNGTLDLTIAGASADLGYMQAFKLSAVHLADANVDVTLPTGVRGEVGLTAHMTILTNNGWTIESPFCQKGLETLPLVMVEVNADHIDAWLR